MNLLIHDVLDDSIHKKTPTRLLRESWTGPIAVAHAPLLGGVAEGRLRVSD